MPFEPKEAVDFLRQVAEIESTNRSDGLADLRFSYGEQWEKNVESSRRLESRPCLTINKVDSYIRQVTNSQRQQRPRIKAHPMDAQADPKIAEVLTGITRHIEIASDADQAYDTAFNFATRIGWGYMRIITDYIREDSFDQDIYVQQIENPLSVYFDPNSRLPDGSDSEKCLITDMMTKKAFQAQYPGADNGGFNQNSTGDSMPEWVDKENIRVAEYFTTERQRQKLVMLSDKTIVWADEMPAPEVLRKAGIEVTGDRESFRKIVQWHKVTAFQTLESKIWPGRWIPVIPVYGEQVIIDGKLRRFGLVRMARDPQIMYNYWRTAMTESVAMAPKAKWVMAAGQDEGYELEWARANMSPFPTLHYKPTDLEGREVPPPTRIQPEPPPVGAMESAQAISNDLQSVLGIFDPSMGKPSGPKSGTAIRAEQGQSEQSNYHYYDNLTRSIKHVGRIILDLVPKVYDTQRVMRIIGDDGKPNLVTLNEQSEKDGIQAILNDVTVGNYDVVMDVGPGYNSKRAEALDAFTSLMGGPLGEEVAKIGGDLIVRLYDAPGMEALADRLAAANPLSKIDEQSDIPPQAQVLIKQLQQQLQQAQQQLQAAEQEIKTKQGIVQMQEAAETQREHMRLTVKAHDIEKSDATKRHDIDSEVQTKAHDAAIGFKKAVSVEEIKGKIALLLAQIGDGAEAKDNAIDSAI